MLSLQNHIRKLRRKNHESRYFVPETALYHLLTQDVIEDTIKTSEVKPYDRGSLVKAVVSGGRKVFAVLILIDRPQLISAFVRHDHFQISSLDHKLPFAESDLEVILPGLSSRFLELQWEFLAPYFSKEKIHRIFHTDTILPFERRSYVGEGNFGAISEVLIPGIHQAITSVSDTEVRSRYL